MRYNFLTGCPEPWSVFRNSCYYMTGKTSSSLNDAQIKCKKLSARLPIIKSESENTFIAGLMSKEKWTWLGMKEKMGKMVWFDNTQAEPSNGAFSAWKENEPTKNNEGCAYLNSDEKTWNDNTCNYGGDSGPYVLCQRKLKRTGS